MSKWFKHSKAAAQAAKAQWMADYQQALVTLVPRLAGRVDWDTAHFLFNGGESAAEAARRTADREASE